MRICFKLNRWSRESIFRRGGGNFGTPCDSLPSRWPKAGEQPPWVSSSEVTKVDFWASRVTMVEADRQCHVELFGGTSMKLPPPPSSLTSL